MSKNPKFMVFHLRELIYTLIFIILGIVLIFMLVFMFKNKDEKASETSGTYKPGTYTSQINLSDATMEVKLTVDENHINSVTMENVDDAIATMYPLVMPAFDDIANQVVTNQSMENIQFQDGSMYTYTLLVQSIEDLIDDAKVKQ